MKSASAPGVRRTQNQVEQKWWDIKSREKQRAANRRQTKGSGKDRKFKSSYTHFRVMSIISKTSIDIPDEVANTESKDGKLAIELYILW